MRAMGYYPTQQEVDNMKDEVKFSKFVSRLRKRFSQLFLRALEKQLVMKNIITPEEWPDLMHKIDFDFADAVPQFAFVFA